MKQYPSISPIINRNTHIWAFSKLDGSNIRMQWSSKRGCYKFGTRKRLLDPKEPILGKAVQLVLDKYADDLALIFKEQRERDAVCFFEFFGSNSFAGWHDPNDKYDIVLLDVSFKKGLLEPKDFIKIFGHLEIPKVLYQGKANFEFEASVRNSTLEDMPLEGCVCKGKYISPGLPLMFKIKSDAWIRKLKEKCKDNQLLFDELL